VFSRSWLIPTALITLFKHLSDLRIHVHKSFLYVRKVLFSIHKIKRKGKNHCMSVQQLAVISILYKLTMSRKYFFIAIFVQGSTMERCC